MKEKILRYNLCAACGKRYVTSGRAKYCSQRCRKITRSNPENYKYKHGVYLAKSGRREHFDSSFEELHMKIWDQKGVDWCRANLIRIPYYDPATKRHRTYEPDFILKTKKGDFLTELKPAALVNKPTNQAKFAAARTWAGQHGYIFQIITSAGQTDGLS